MNKKFVYFKVNENDNNINDKKLTRDSQIIDNIFNEHKTDKIYKTDKID